MRKLIAIGALVSLLVAGCAGAGTDAVVTTEPGGGGLAVQVAGEIVDDRICIGWRPPCIEYEGVVEPSADGRVVLRGRLVDGRLIVDEQVLEPPLVPPGYFDNQCADQGISGPPPNAWMEQTEGDFYGGDWVLSGFAEMWDADDGTVHLAVAGDLGEAADYLEAAGAAGQICVVEVPYSFAELQAALSSAMDLAREWEGGGSGSINPRVGDAQLYLERMDDARRAAIEQVSADHGGVPIRVEAAVDVDGSLDDWDLAIAAADDPSASGAAGITGLAATCSQVRFSSVPPNLDEFPPIDADGLAALAELVGGETGVEAGGFDTDYKWTMAFRSDDELVLFGQSASGNLATASFDKREGDWAPRGWGGCRVQVEAPGYGPATVAVDPDRPIDTAAVELGLLINEQTCASGQAPVDREVVPIITETAASVEITVLVESVRGGADCPSNPSHPITITLAEPLGDRTLVDTHTYPPVVVE